MRGQLILSTLILLMFLTTGMTTSSAASFNGPYQTMRLAAANGVSLDEAVARVKEQTKGRILTAETIERKGKQVHRIKVLLPNGSVRVMYVDAE